jgi:hypothetical protein
LKNELPGDTGMCRIENRDVPHRKSNTQVFDFRSEARTCAVPNELKNAMEGVFNKSV